MDRDNVDWKGYWPSCPTPFKRGDESVDLDALRALLEFYVGCGFHGVLINGTVGEWFSQSERERLAVAETAIDQVAGRMTVVIGCTAYTADEVAGYGRHAMAAGADGVEASAPPYSKPFPDEILQYYRDISAAVDGPLLVYNWPHGTNVEIRPELFDELVEVDTVVAVKDSTPNAEPVLRDNPPGGGPGPGVRPVHDVEGSRGAADHWRRWLHRGWERVRPAGRPVLGGVLAGRLSPIARSTPGGRKSCSPSSGCRAAGPASMAPTRAS